ncbi:MAG: hypothetical protein KAI17_27495, partial [Thiotrichaceae bacterium]|nr:hypothetical protein [Thiotrichaceae bacterium]
GKYTGPENRKTSGKAYGAKRKKAIQPKKTRKKVKTRVRDRKNIGKRRKSSGQNLSDKTTTD